MAGTQFHISNGQIIDPNGDVFVARGFNIGPQDMTAVAQSGLALFPGLNFIRLAIPGGTYPDASTFQSFVTQMTAKGVVVEIEDHPFPSPGVYSGAQLQQESNWYASLATAFKDNPYVWFGTMNEPNTGSYGASEAAISVQEQATYNAIRGTGSNAIIMNELYGGGNPGTVGAGFGMTPSTYANMTNIVWDFHSYGWDSNYSIDQAAVTAALMGSASGGYGIAAAQSIHSADGLVPVIMGEFGDSTIGSSVDANGTQVVNAVLNSGFGYAAWTWGGQGGADQLTQNGQLTAFGQEVAAGIAATAVRFPSKPPVTVKPSPNDTVVLIGSAAAITNAAGEKWTITAGGQVAVNGVADTTTSGVIEIAYVNGLVWQENASKLWWSKTNSTNSWTGGTSTNPVPVPSANNTVVLLGSTAAITNAAGDKWTITAGGQVAVNGVADTTTSGVIEIAYVNGLVWQENAGKLWWGKSSASASWTGGTSTSPLPPPAPPTIVQSSNDTIVTVGSTAAITDTSGNKWTITAGGQVAVNGVADTTTGNVKELAYVKGVVSQENTSNLWWSKTSPTASWTGGTAASPLPSTVAVPATPTTVTLTQSNVLIYGASGSHMMFISGSGNTVNLSGGTNTITDTGKVNTYIVPVAGNGYDSFTSNVLSLNDKLDLSSALAATTWDGAASTLSKYLTIANTAQGAVLSIAPTSGGVGVAVATIGGATGVTLTNFLPHAVL